MRLFPFVLGLLLAALPALPAAAETFRSPQALLEALYSGQGQDLDPSTPTLYAPFFSEQLNGRFQADRDTTPDGEMGALEFDPVISGQDGEASNIEIGEPIVIDTTAEVEVTFENGGSVTLYYTLVKENGGWKVDDIANQQGEYPWSLSAIFDGQ